MNLIDIYRTLHSKNGEYTSFLGAHGLFSTVDHILGYNTSLNKFKSIEIMSHIFSEHSGMKLEINYRKKMGKEQTSGD